MDVRIAIYFAEGGPHAPEGLGWYASATCPRDGKIAEIIPRVRLTPKNAVAVGKVLDNLTNGKPMNWNGDPQFLRISASLAEIIEEANLEAKGIAQTKLGEAEEAIRKLEALKARAGEFDD